MPSATRSASGPAGWQLDEFADDDVIAVMWRRHQTIQQLLTATAEATLRDRDASYAALRLTMIAQETLEQMIITPRLRRWSDGLSVSASAGAPVVPRLRRLDGLDPGSAMFRTSLSQLAEHHGDHLRRWAREIPALLFSGLDSAGRERLGRLARSIDPIITRAGFLHSSVRHLEGASPEGIADWTRQRLDSEAAGHSGSVAPCGG